MRIVLTNDDGFDAPGLTALWQAVSLLPAAEIEVIAPAESHSGKGHVLSKQITCRRRTIEPIGSVVVVEGTPVDCVCAALHLPDLARPDWILAGINRGSNLGVDQYNSGTVAAVRQAAIFGIPAIAVSQHVIPNEPDDWTRAAREAAAVLAAIMQPNQPPPPHVDTKLHALAHRAIFNVLDTTPATGLDAAPAAGLDSNPAAVLRTAPAAVAGAATPELAATPRLAATPELAATPRLAATPELAAHTPPSLPPCWNVNLPKLPADQPPVGVCFAPVSRDPGHIRYDHRREPDGTEHLSYTGIYRQRPVTPETDVAAVFAGQITISRLEA